MARTERAQVDVDADGTGHLAPETASGETAPETARATLRASDDERSESRGLAWRVAAGLGVASLVAAVVVVLAPAVVLPAEGLANDTVRSLRSFARLLAAFVGIAALYVAYHRETDATETVSQAVELPVERSADAGPDRDVPGAKLDESLAVVGGVVDESHDEAYRAYKVRESLQGLAARVVSTRADCSMERARERVAAGTWTDDVRAAALLADGDEVERPLRMRFRDWASGESFDRQVEAAVDELATLVEVDES